MHWTLKRLQPQEHTHYHSAQTHPIRPKQQLLMQGKSIESINQKSNRIFYYYFFFFGKNKKVQQNIGNAYWNSTQLERIFCLLPQCQVTDRRQEKRANRPLTKKQMHKFTAFDLLGATI
jgi:hypothetical protein